MASTRFNKVAGDRKADLTFVFTDKQNGNTPINLAASTTTVVFWFREEGNESKSIFSQTCTKVGDGSLGQVTMPWPASKTDGLVGSYEGQVVLSFNSLEQTIYDFIKFNFRKDFGAVA